MTLVRSAAAVVAGLLLSGCHLMPDLIGLPAAEAGRELGERAWSSSWEGPVAVRCAAAPRTVAWQRPLPGTPLRAGRVDVRIRLAALDLDAFRGPCPAPRPPRTPDERRARAFYRFAADPTLGAPFADVPTWVGIAGWSRSALLLDASARGDLRAWRIRTLYAERSGPFSPLDLVAGSGGHYVVRPGVEPTCPTGERDRPPALVGMRAISLLPPPATVTACMDTWSVTLFLDGADRITGVVLRLGSP